MTPTDPALMSAETLLALYARRALSPVEALQAVMRRVAELTGSIEKLLPRTRYVGEVGLDAGRGQQPHLARQRRLRDVQHTRGLAEAAQLGHADEVFQLLEVHAAALSAEPVSSAFRHSFSNA